MTKIKLPPRYNYIGVFLTYRCNMYCSYCLNRYADLKRVGEMGLLNWVNWLSAIETTNDLPITLQGGEPTEYPHFYDLVSELYSRRTHMDLLTNGNFDPDVFMCNVSPLAFNRRAKYASIRISLHESSDDGKIVRTANTLKDNGYSVGIWGIDLALMKRRNDNVAYICDKLGVDFRLKEYLSHVNGTYKYPAGLDGVAKSALCTSNELLISPNGEVYRCHADLYSGVHSLGYLCDDFEFPLTKPCAEFGYCNPCDMKLKTNRFQESKYCSVTVE